MLKHGKQPALFALLALATMSARSDVIIEVEKGLQSNDKDVQAVARFILASSSGDWSPDALLTAVRDGEISVSTAAERALRIMARMHPQNR